MPTYELLLRVQSENLRDAKFIGECITDPGAQVADLARQMGATILGVQVAEAP